MDDIKRLACDTIDKEKDNLFQLSQDIWHHKELAYKEHKSHETLTLFLEKRGFRVERHCITETAFIARYENHSSTTDTRSGSTEGGAEVRQNPLHVAVLCEYDALPEVGHACGHNLIAEIGVAAGLGIKSAMEVAGIAGKLSVIGTPAEEGGGGKIDLIKAGVFDDVDFAMMSHPAPFTDAAPAFLGTRRSVLRYHGRASHAAGFPWEGVNALDAAVLAYVNISALRQQLQPAWRVHAIIPKGGVKTNIIPDETELAVQVRAPRDSELDELERKVKQCCTSAAASTGCTYDVTDSEKPYSSLITNNTLGKLYRSNGSLVGVEFPPISTKQVLGSTDMGNLSHVVPALHPTYYCGTEAFNHTHEFAQAAGSPEAQSYTIAQGKALALVALDVLQKPELALQMKQDFELDLQSQ